MGGSKGSARLFALIKSPFALNKLNASRGRFVMICSRCPRLSHCRLRPFLALGIVVTAAAAAAAATLCRCGVDLLLLLLLLLLLSAAIRAREGLCARRR